MGHIYLHWIRNKFHYKPVQKDQLKNCISNQQYCPEFTKAQTTDTRHIHTIQSVQTDVPQLQEGVCGANW